MGTPAFMPGGKVIGLLTLRQIDTGRQSMFAGMGGPEGLGLLPVILPAAGASYFVRVRPVSGSSKVSVTATIEK